MELPHCEFKSRWITVYSPVGPLAVRLQSVPTTQPHSLTPQWSLMLRLCRVQLNGCPFIYKFNISSSAWIIEEQKCWLIPLLWDFIVRCNEPKGLWVLLNDVYKIKLAWLKCRLRFEVLTRHSGGDYQRPKRHSSMDCSSVSHTLTSRLARTKNSFNFELHSGEKLCATCFR